MNLWSMAWRYLWQRPLIAVLNIASVALGTGLIAVMLTVQRQTEAVFLRDAATWDLVVGAKGSPLQLILSTIFHLDIPTGNIPYARYQALRGDGRVRAAVPVGLGDNYRGFRIVGTSAEFFALERRVKKMRGKQGGGRARSRGGYVSMFALEEGRFFAGDFEAVLGAQAAAESGLKLGDEFYGTHGLVELAGSEEHRDFPYRVVGVLEASGTANDRAIFTTLESVWLVHDKEAALHHEEVAEDVSQREVTAVLVQLKAVGLRMFMADEIQRGTESMAAVPIDQMHRMYQRFLRPMERVLVVLAGLVVVVACLSIVATLFQAGERRRRDVALMRSLGAQRGEVFALVMLETLLLVALGVGLGWLLGHGGLALQGERVRALFGVGLNPWSVGEREGWALAVVLLAGLLAGLLPAIRSYRRSALTAGG